MTVEETGEAGENLCGHGENMQTPPRKNPRPDQELNPGPFFL